jgi:hypothetical protein
MAENILYMDMRTVEAGSSLDEFHFASWASFLRFALDRDDFRQEFEQETGERFIPPDGSAIGAAIDAACGVGLERQRYIHRFALWVTPRYFGDETNICPAIQKVLERPDPK